MDSDISPFDRIQRWNLDNGTDIMQFKNDDVIKRSELHDCYKVNTIYIYVLGQLVNVEIDSALSSVTGYTPVSITLCFIAYL